MSLTELLVAVAIGIQHETGFLLLGPVAEPTGAKENAQFKGHVEPWQAVRVQLRPGDIVDAPTAFPDDARDLLDAHLASIVDLQRTSRPQAAFERGENEGLEDGLVVVVEGGS